MLSPTEMPFTADDFDPQLAASLELMPELLGDEKAGIRYAINGLISMTPDGHPLLGETPEVKGLWAAAASWIKEGPGCGRAVAELMSGKVPAVDVHEAAVSRFYPSSRTTGFARARAAESFNKMYGIVHPAEQYESERPLRTGPLYERARELGAVFRETARWERPHWYASNEPLLAKYAGRLMERPAEWESRWWSPIINAEHLAMREAGGIVDLSAFTILDVTGPGALAGLQRLAVAQLDVPAGRTVYTPFLNEAGRFVADLTIMRLRANHFRVVTGAADGGRDAQWISDRLPDDAQLADVSSAWSTIGLWGPRVGDVLASANRDGDNSKPRAVRDASNPLNLAVRSSSPRGSPTWASSAGSCTCPRSRPGTCGTCCSRRAGRTAWCRSGSASTGPPGGWRRGTGRSGRSSPASTTRSRRE